MPCFVLHKCGENNIIYIPMIMKETANFKQSHFILPLHYSNKCLSMNTYGNIQNFFQGSLPTSFSDSKFC